MTDFDWTYVRSLASYADFWEATMLVVWLSVLTWTLGTFLGFFVALAKHTTLRGAASLDVAAVVHAVMWQRSPAGAEVPSAVDSSAARLLQEHAWSFVSEWRATRREPSFAACRDQLRGSFIGQHWSYVRDSVWRPADGAWKAWLRWAQQMFAWHVRVRRSNEGNPFRDG